MSNLSGAQKRALKRALRRERKTIFPIPDIPASAAGLLHKALVRRGLATDEIAPRLTTEGTLVALALSSEEA